MIITNENEDIREEEVDEESQPLLPQKKLSLSRVRGFFNAMKAEDRRIKFSFGFFVAAMMFLSGIFTYIFYYFMRDIDESKQFQADAIASINHTWNTKPYNVSWNGGDVSTFTCSNVFMNWRDVNSRPCWYGLMNMKRWQKFKYDPEIKNFAIHCYDTFLSYCEMSSAERKEVIGDGVLMALLGLTVVGFAGLGYFVHKYTKQQIAEKALALFEDAEISDLETLFVVNELGEFDALKGHEVYLGLENFMTKQFENAKKRETFLQGQFENNAIDAGVQSALKAKLTRAKSCHLLSPRGQGFFAETKIKKIPSLPNLVDRDKRTPLQRFFACDGNRDLTLKILRHAEVVPKLSVGNKP